MTRRVHRTARPVGDYLGPALRALGMPSKKLTSRLIAAWEQASDPSWEHEARPDRFVGGVLVVAVDSAALRDELAQFHRARLLDVLKTALPGVSLVGIRFTLAEGDSTSKRTLP